MAAITGTFDKDALAGTENDDVITGSAGDDQINGGPGDDVAVFSGGMAGYTITSTGTTVTVTDTRPADGDDGSDTLQNIQALRFADGEVALAMGPEFRVNTTTAGYQYAPSLASLAEGGFVVSWCGTGAGDDDGIFGRLYDAAGVPQGDEFRVNTATGMYERESSITALADGGFVVTWAGGTVADSGIFGRRYDAGGVALGGEFRVDTTAAHAESSSSVTALTGGGFVVMWQSQNESQDPYSSQRYSAEIHGRLYDASGVAQGGEFLVDTHTQGYEHRPAVGTLDDGGFVVTWQAPGQAAGGFGIYGQRYDAQGVPLGSEFHVNTYQSEQTHPSVAELHGGRFVVLWQSRLLDSDHVGICGQIFDANGVAEGNEFRLNSTVSSDQGLLSVASDGADGFLAVWSTGYEVHVQRYTPQGKAVGEDVVVDSPEGNTGSSHTGSSYSSHAPLVAPDGSAVTTTYPTLTWWFGNTVVRTWTSYTAETGHDISAGAGQITFVGSDRDDSLLAGIGNEFLRGGDGNDVLSGGEGLNVLDGGPGNDVLDGSRGLDWADYSSAGSGRTVSLTLGAWAPEGGDTDILVNIEHLRGTAFDDLLIGDSQTNRMEGSAGHDWLFGGGGTDYMNGGSGDDVLVGDLFAGELGADILEGGRGNDILIGGELYDTLGGGSGDDWLFGGNGSDISMHGGAGNDVIYGDLFAGEIGSDWAYGDDGNDILIGGADTDVLYGNADEDWLFGSDGGDTLYGCSGNDVLYGDLFAGEAGADTLWGDEGTDILIGGVGADTMFGGDGNDALYGLDGGDRISGGSGADRFICWSGDFGAAVGGEISDFSGARGQGDKIDVSFALDAFGYAGNSPFDDGWLDLQQIGGGTQLLLDPDGTQGGAESVSLVKLVGVSEQKLNIYDDFIV